MSDKPKRQRPTYKHRTNAVCVSVYSPTGETIPAEVRNLIEESVWNIAQQYKLLINIATT